MDGTIGVSSTVGVGSTFSACIPFTLVPDIALPAPSALLDGLRVLCVDGSEENLGLLQSWLSRAGANVFTAGTASEANDLFQIARETGGPIQLVVFDVATTGGDLRHVLDRMHGEDPSVGFVQLAAPDCDDHLDDLSDGFRAGRMLKPLRPSALCAALAEIIAAEQGADAPQALPSARPHVERQLEGAAPGGPSIRRATILVAEDNKTNRLVISKMLRDQPVELQFAEDGRAAVDQFRELDVDMIFMDLSMPEMDGVEATGEIRRIETDRGLARTPVIALTANAMHGDREKCLQAGMDAYLSKPVRKGELLAMIRDYWPASADAVAATKGVESDDSDAFTTPISASR